MQTDRRTDEDRWAARLRHSRHYHRYFQGYTEVRVDKPGGYRVERYYTAPWKEHALERGQWIRLKLLYAVLALPAAVALAVSMRLNVLSNYLWFVFLPGFIAFLCAFLLCAHTASYISKHRRMTLWDFHSSSCYIRRAALAVAVASGLTVLMKLGCIALYGTDGLPGELISILLLLVTVVAVLGIFFRERAVKYRDIPNDTKKPVNGDEVW